MKFFHFLFKSRTVTPVEDIHCPVCGYYCLGKGGVFCIDKKGLFEATRKFVL